MDLDIITFVMFPVHCEVCDEVSIFRVTLSFLSPSWEVFEKYRFMGIGLKTPNRPNALSGARHVVFEMVLHDVTSAKFRG